MYKNAFHIIVIIFLTVITQIGGLVYLLAIYIYRKWKIDFKFKFAFIFILLYLFITLFVIPFIVPVFGREKIKHTEKIQPANYATVLLNRNYVKPQLNLLLAEAEKELVDTEITINYLDANFPFINKFPLLPHLSHNDGKKLDLSLIYEESNGKISKNQKSVSGYGVFEEPENMKYSQASKC